MVVCVTPDNAKAELSRFISRGGKPKAQHRPKRVLELRKDFGKQPGKAMEGQKQGEFKMTQVRFLDVPDTLGPSAGVRIEDKRRPRSKNRSKSRNGRKKSKEMNRKPLVGGSSSEDHEEEEDEGERETKKSPQSSNKAAQERLGRAMDRLTITRKKSKSRSKSKNRKDPEGRHQPMEVEKKNKEEEEKEEEEDDSCLEASLNKALKHYVHDIFKELYLRRFFKTHGKKTPYAILIKIPKANKEINSNKMMMQVLKRNNHEEFDITTLFLILRFACGYAVGDAPWNDTKTIEGNIKALKDIRNYDSHRTPQGNKSVKELWRLLRLHVILLVHLSELTEKFPNVEEDLDRIRNEMKHKEISIDRRKIQEAISQELKESFRRTSHTSLMPLIWAGTSFEYKFPVLETYTKTQLEIRSTSGGTLCTDAHSLFEKVNFCKRILLEGESGTGKTSILRYYASGWANSSSSLHFLENYKYLFLLDCKAFTNKTASLSDVVLEILPKACSKWRQKDILSEITHAGDKVLFLIDALDERTDAFKTVFKTIQNRCPEAFFVVTMRPHCTETIKDLCNKSPSVVTSKGFTYSSSLKYAEKVFQAVSRRKDPKEVFQAVSRRKDPKDPKEFLKEISEFKELVEIPQLLVWTAWFYLEGKTNFSRRGEIFDKLTSFMLRKMCFIHEMRIMAKEVPPQGKEWLDVMAKIAFKMHKDNVVSIDQSSIEFKELEKAALKLGLRPNEALSTLMQCNSLMTSEGKLISYQFLHESHADYLVAYHVASTGKFEELKSFSNDRLNNIVQCVTWLLFKDNHSPSKEILKKIISLRAKQVTFFDLRSYLSLINESNYNEDFLKLLSSYPPDSPLVAQQESSISKSKPPGYKPAIAPFKNIDKNKSLWINGKQLKHKKALECLLREIKPSRICLRLCLGIRETDDDPSQNFTELEASSALAMLKSVYGKTPLAELRVSDTILEGNPDFPERLWWLKLERCTLKKNTSLPGSLLKLSLLECFGTGKVGIPNKLQHLRMESCRGYNRLGPNNTLKAIELVDCDFEELGHLGSLEKIHIYSCRIEEPLTFPKSLRHLHIQNMSPKILQIPQDLQTLEITLTTKTELKEAKESETLHDLMEAQRVYIEDLKSMLVSKLGIKIFLLCGILQPPEEILHLAITIREMLPNASVCLQSYSSFDIHPLCDYFHDVVSTHSRPRLRIQFVDKVFDNMED